MATELVTDAPKADDSTPNRPGRSGADTPETTAPVDPVEPAAVEEFPAAPSDYSEVVEPTPQSRAGESGPAGDDDADEPDNHLMTPIPDAAVPEKAGDATPGTDDPAGGIVAEDAPVEPAAPPEPESKKKWYIVKVTSGREESIKASIERRVKIENLEEFFGQVYIPVERTVEVRKVKETKNGERITKEKRITKARKKFPGYLMAEVEYNDSMLYLFRETSGVGDFVGAGPNKVPMPMIDIDIQRMLSDGTVPDDNPKGPKGPRVKVKIDFEKGDKVRIRDGAFANMEGDIKEITLPKDSMETPKVTVVVQIFGRGVEMELDYWQVDKV